MNKILYAILMSLLLFVSCEKDELPVVTPVADDTKKEVEDNSEDNSTDLKGIKVDDVEFNQSGSFQTEMISENTDKPVFLFVLTEGNGAIDSPRQITFSLDNFSKEDKKEGDFPSGVSTDKTINVVYSEGGESYISHFSSSESEKIKITDLGNNKFRIEFSKVVVLGSYKDSEEVDPSSKKVISGVFEGEFKEEESFNFGFSGDSDLLFGGDELKSNYLYEYDLIQTDTDPIRILALTFVTDDPNYSGNISVSLYNTTMDENIDGTYQVNENGSSIEGSKRIDIDFTTAEKFYDIHQNSKGSVVITQLGENKYKLEFIDITFVKYEDNSVEKILDGKVEGVFQIR